jgi:hypothetical protein
VPDLSIFDQRKTYSEQRLAELRNRLAKEFERQDFPDLVIFAAGSYARLEASQYSDIDLFFIYEGERDTDRPNTKELRMFGRLIELIETMDYPPFSNDCQYLTAAASEPLIQHLGGPTDDATNNFTLRMLMLLESRPIVGDDAHQRIQREIVDSYYRDFPDHQASFEPWFLLNDISRFWKTLLLNYENRRNQRRDDPAEKAKHKVRNFKLKFSRMTTCFATIAAMGTMNTPISADEMMTLISEPPRRRLELAAERRPSLTANVNTVLEDYAWFLEQTGLTEPELRGKFEDKSTRTELFARARSYGGKMYELLAAIDADAGGPESNFIRYLVI